MENNETRIWIWFQDSKLHKAKCDFSKKTLIIYNENDEILIKYKGLTSIQIQKIGAFFSKIGAKRIDNQNNPFTYM